jgi:hypothetical protein
LKGQHVIGGDSIPPVFILVELFEVRKFIKLTGTKQNILIDGATAQQESEASNKDHWKLIEFHL